MNTLAAVLTALENAPSILVPLVREVPADKLKVRPRPERWSAHEQACHIAAVQPLFATRLERMLAEDHPRIVPYRPEGPEEDDSLLNSDLDEALERFVAERRKVVERLRSLTPAQWERTAEHPEYARYTVFIMARHFALHDMLHAYRIEEILLAR